MANPVNNNGINANVSVGGDLKADVKIGGTARVSDNQSQGIFESVNENYTKNPNHSRSVGYAQDSNQAPQSNAKGADAPPAQNEDYANDPPRANRTNNQETGEDGALINSPARG